VETAVAEVRFHKTVELEETDFLYGSIVYQDYLADVHALFHDVRDLRDKRTLACFDPDSYENSQLLAQQLLETGSVGVVYPAVRHPGGDAVACFRPAVVNNVRRARRYRLTWNGDRTPSVDHLSEERTTRADRE
jgi:hypothetical protein